MSLPQTPSQRPLAELLPAAVCLEDFIMIHSLNKISRTGFINQKSKQLLHLLASIPNLRLMQHTRLVLHKLKTQGWHNTHRLGHFKLNDPMLVSQHKELSHHHHRHNGTYHLFQPFFKVSKSIYAQDTGPIVYPLSGSILFQGLHL